MSAKSVIEIDVKDERFKAFTAEFEKFKDSVKDLNKSWVKFNKDKEDSEKKSIKSAKELLKIYRDYAKQTKTIAYNVASTATSLAKWAAFGSITGGFGLGTLAFSAAGNRRQAQGIGVTTGQLQSANVAYGTKFVNSGSLLSNIANIQSDYSSRFLIDALVGKGSSNKSVGELLPLILNKIAQRFIQTGGNQAAFQAYGLNRFVSIEDARRLAAGYKSGELGRANRLYSQNIGKFDIQDSTNQAWADFIIKLKEAGVTIENSLIKSLVKLTPTLTKFAEDISKSLSKYLESGQFAKDVESVGKAMVSLANAINYVVSILPQSVTNAPIHQKRAFGAYGNFNNDKLTSIGNFLSPENVFSGISNEIGIQKQVFGIYGTNYKNSITSVNNFISSKFSGIKKANSYMDYLTSHGVSELAAAALIGGAVQESSLLPHTSKSGHEGLFQWSSERQADYNQWASSKKRRNFANSSIKDQLDFAIYELFSGKERKAGAALLAATDLYDASQAAYSFERPGKKDTTFSTRYSYARDIYNARHPYNEKVLPSYLMQKPSLNATFFNATGNNITWASHALPGG